MTLNDSLWQQLMTSNKAFTLLNIDKKTKSALSSPSDDPNLLHASYLDLSNEVKIEKRRVLSLLGAFGELGGIYQFFSFFIFVLVGRFPAKLLAFDQVMTLFRTTSKSPVQDVASINDF